MSYPLLAPDMRPCVWMCAGVIRYRLCDLDYECDCCPLDAALRREGAGQHWQRPAEDREPVPAPPSDRGYAPGHTWIRTLPHPKQGRCSLGIDAFGAAVLGVARRAAFPFSSGRDLAVGDLVCVLDIGPGRISIGCPVRGRLERINPEIRRRPGIVLEDPYHRGWIAELSRVEPSDLEALGTAPLACERAGRDLRRFRRDVALRLFRDLALGASSWREGAAQTDLRDVLGGSYVELVAGLVH